MLDVLINMTLFAKTLINKATKSNSKNSLPSLVGVDKALVKSKEITTKLICFFLVIFPFKNCHSCFYYETTFLYFSLDLLTKFWS